MTTEAMVTEGVTIARGNGDGPPETFTTIAELSDFNGPDGQAAVIRVPHMQSTFVDKLMGLPDEGQITLSGSLIPSNAAQSGLRDDRKNRVLRNFEITLTDTGATKLSFAAYVLQYAPSGAVEDKISVSITLEISGEVTWT